MKLFGNKNFEDPSVTKHGTGFEVNKWIISEFVLEKLVPAVSWHPFPLDELMLMTAAVCRVKPSLIFEWGTNIGKSARVFHEVCEAFRINAAIHSIDLPDDVFHVEHPQHHRGRFVKGIKRVTLHQGDGLSTALNLAEKLAPKGNILFFIDGDHSYTSVKRELETVLNRLPAAAVLLHDTFWQSPDSNYNVGPCEAIRDVLKARSGSYEVIATQGGLPGMSFVQRKS